MARSPVARGSALGVQVADDLRRRIITRALPADGVLIEAKLADEYEVSRGPARDAIRTLAQEGLVENRGRSAHVIGLHAGDVDELFALRSALEDMALASGSRKHRSRLVAELRAAVAEMDCAVEHSDPVAFTRADMQFHSAFLRSSELRRIHDVWSQYQRTIENLLLVANLEHTDLKPAKIRHEQLAAMVEAGNDAASLAELKDHLDASRRRVRRDYAGVPADGHADEASTTS